MNVIGFLCELDRKNNTRVLHSSFVLHRVKPLYDYLKQHDIKLFMYNPAFIEPNTLVVKGYFFDGRNYFPAIRWVPKINANYFLHPPRWFKQDMGYKTYQKWSAGLGIKAFPSWNVADTFVDKLKTYEIVNECMPNFHPYTELYDHSESQVQSFTQKSKRLFFKKRSGARGEEMLVSNFIDNSYVLDYHAKKKVDRYQFKTLSEMVNKINVLVEGHDYIIQEGVVMDKLDDSVFYIRMIMYHDSENWGFVDKSLISGSNCYVAHSDFGAKLYYTKALLKKIYGEARYMDVFNTVANKCLELTRLLDGVFSGQIMEVAYDCLVKKDGEVCVVEVNTHPGMGQVEPIKDVFNMSEQDVQTYDTYIKPYMEGVGAFLHKKLIWSASHS